MPIDAKHLRGVLGSYPTGVTIVTTVDALAQPIGVTVNSFASLSLDPPLISWCLRRTSYSLPAFRHSRRFIINVLGASHGALCLRFAKGDAHKWQGVDFRPGANGCPSLAEAIATLECTHVGEYDTGDHVLMIGEITRAWAIHGAHPLVFFRGGYYELARQNDPPLAC